MLRSRLWGNWFISVSFWPAPDCLETGWATVPFDMSPNAPSLNDLLGTITLSILAGNRRYAHVTALRGDTVNPQGLGMSRVLSEDAVRRAFAEEEAGPLESWQREHLWRSVEPALKAPWICDIDVTVKTIYGQQEGAEVGYNPHKPGRPAHAYHTFLFHGCGWLWMWWWRRANSFTAGPSAKSSGSGGRGCPPNTGLICCGEIAVLATRTSWWNARDSTASSAICFACA